jgi:hypothetical protein
MLRAMSRSVPGGTYWGSGFVETQVICKGNLPNDAEARMQVLNDAGGNLENPSQNIDAQVSS